MAAGGDDEEEDGSGDGAKAGKKRASKKAAGSGSARQQLTGFEGCTHLFSDADVYPAYQQGRCQAFHSGTCIERACQWLTEGHVESSAPTFITARQCCNLSCQHASCAQGLS